ncbi:MAG: AMP-binding protein [Campylobacterota bacterium]
MNITILNDDSTKKVYTYDEFYDKSLTDKILAVSGETKEESIKKILSAYFSNAKPIIYDKNNKTIDTMLGNFDDLILQSEDFRALFFTSGTTGTPTGALKTFDNIDIDLDDLVKIFDKFSVTNVVATVPFVHVYGFLVGLMLPYKLGVDLVFKEHFLPHDLLEVATKGSLVVTTPLYIKSLIQLDEQKDLKDVVFVSSTGPLSSEIAKEFIEKFNTTLIQIFGSTETGSIAYKMQDDELWQPFESVEISLNSQGLLGIKSPYVSPLLLQNNKLEKTDSQIQSFDYASVEDGKFKLIGRDIHIIKVAGKRYSTIQIEDILEQIEGINKAFVYVEHRKNELKDEILKVFIESQREVKSKEIKEILKQNFGHINIPLELAVVDKIPTTAMGKKCMPI